MPFRVRTHISLVVALACLQSADLLCTYLLLDGGRADVYEANPLARSILAASGWLGLALFKVTITAVAAAACLALARRRRAIAVRVLAGLCVLMLGVNGYSGTLLASPDRAAQDERQAIRESESLNQHIDQKRAFVRLREAVCDAVLAGECDTAEAACRLSKAIGHYGTRLNLPAAARLPDPSRNDQVLAYLSHHLRERAATRGLSDRLPQIASLAPPPGRHDAFTPPWLAAPQAH